MLVLRAFVIISTLFCLLNTLDIRSSNDTLVLTHVIFRHGDRNPVPKSLYPTDPWKDLSNWPEGLGVNTKLGIQQAYELGKYLRERYQTILGNGKFLENLVHVQSTDFIRTLSCAAAVVAGMFPPKTDEMFHPDIKWYPIAVHTIPLDLDLDHILYGGRPCQKLRRAYDQYHASEKYKKEFNQFKSLFEYLEKHSGVKIQNFTNVVRLYDTLWIEKQNNKTPGTDFEWASDRHFRTYSLTPELFRYTYGYLIREIFDHCTAKIEEKLSPNRTMFLYSAHDTNIASILNIFGLFAQFGYHIPPYASSLHFDLYKTPDNQYYIQLTYRHNNKPTLLRFPECGTKCSIEDLRKMYVALIPTAEFEEECRLPFHIRLIEGYNIFGPDSGIIVAITVAITAPITFFLSWLFFTLKNGKQILKAVSKRMTISNK